MPLASTTNLTITPSPAFFEDQVEFDITVTGSGPTPTGNVLLHDDVGDFTDQTLVLASGATFYITNSLSPGIHNITATYQGNGTYAVSHRTLTEEIIAISIPLTILPGFALQATFSSTGDAALTPSAELFAIPSSGPAFTPITLVWTVLNVEQIEITGPAGFDTGLISTTGSGIHVVNAGFAVTTVLTLACYDALGNPILVGGNPLATTTTVTVV
jgi:hypothetical protein